ncbi:hypothetical protein [Silvanigrella aquatica]|uniref:SMP-30/Gluconolactonase/LRE-like region domain-containing protein n=1 Tax=Silvanigrella aquatica TaxID=1915309 RepID=A0A1L4D1F9_9BACT|nr:hypothetical protein [Silvanigrella aquatica]APJ04027.1 hypothetical protein AXG55_08945 [Silvanigrella aquatica]
MYFFLKVSCTLSLLLILTSCGLSKNLADPIFFPEQNKVSNSISSADDNVASVIKNSNNPYYVITNRDKATLTVCKMDDDGHLGNCNDTQKPGYGSTADAVGFSEKHVYITRHGTPNDIAAGTKGYITSCEYDSSSVSISSCIKAGGLTALNGPEGLKIFNNKAYIIDSNADKLLICSIDKVSNTLTSCRDSRINSSLLQYPTNITFKEFKAYIASFLNKSILICDYQKSNGNIEKCNKVDIGYDGPHSISFNGNFAYVTATYENIIVKCPLLDNGTLGQCQNSGANKLSAPRGNVQFVNGFAYVASSGDDKIYKCTVNPDGKLSSCEDSGADHIAKPFSVDKMP